MKVFLVFIFSTISIIGFTKEKSDSTRYPLQVSGAASLNSNGIAPVPSFALGKPAITLNLTLKKRWFSYDPQFSYGLDFRPWIMDNWFHFRIIDKTKFELRTGFNISTFFSEYQTPAQFVWHGQKYGTLELAGIYKFSPTSSIGLMGWYDKGFDTGTVTGYFIDVAYDKTDVPIGKHLLFAVNVQLFYIDYTGNSDGFFVSPKLALTARKLPLSIFFQGIQALSTNITPFPEFQWNIGVGYAF